jgi:Concanavalin A-like lectin/glucanases superfamily/Putative peptidoglycan binding domain
MTYASEVLADSPLAYYRHGEASGTTLVDSSGNGRNGTWTVAPTAFGVTGLISGDADTAVEYSGTTSGTLATVTDAAWMDSTYLTVEMWVKPDAANIGLVSRDDGTFDRVWRTFLDSSRRIDFAVWNQSETVYQNITTETLTLGQTYHVVCTYDGSSVKVYINGRLSRSVAATGTLITSLNENITVGKGSSNIRMDGVMDEVAIYGTPLSAERILDHYEIGSDTSPDLPVVEYAKAFAASGPTVVPNLVRTPAVGDRVYALAKSARASGGRTITSVTGLGATWTLVDQGSKAGLWVGTGATTAGAVTITMSGTGTVQGSVYLLRDMSASAVVEHVVNASVNGEVTGADLPAGNGQFVISTSISTVNAISDFPSVEVPATGWRTFTGSDNNVNYGEFYRIPSEASTTHRADTTLSATSSFSNTIIVLGDEVGAPEVAADLSGSGAFTADVVAVHIVTASLGGSGSLTVSARVLGPNLHPDPQHELGDGNGWWFGTDTSSLPAGLPPEYTHGAYVDKGSANPETGVGFVMYGPAMELGRAMMVGAWVRAVSDTGWSGRAENKLSMVTDTETWDDYDLVSTKIVQDTESWRWVEWTLATIDPTHRYPTVDFYAYLTDATPGPEGGKVRVYATGVEIRQEVWPVAPLVGSGSFTAEVEAALTVPQVAADLAGAGALTAEVLAVEFVAASLAGSGVLSAAVEVVVPAVTADLTGTGALSATVVLVGPAVTAHLTGTGALSAVVEIVGRAAADTQNRAGGRARDGLGAAVWEPPVEPPPTSALAQPLAYDVAAAFSNITMVGKQPTYDVTTAAVPRTRTRVVVGGKDVTYYRGVVTPSPSYQLIEPLLYGPATLELPQVSATFEEPGVGRLRWLRKGKPVTVQRVNSAGVVVATDYRGIVVAFNVDGRNLSVEIGGQASGRAALTNKQVPIFRAVRDAGELAYDGITNLGLQFKPRLGPTTGIRLARFGGMSRLDYLNELCAKAQDRDGTQWTIMPNAAGVYRMTRKDTTTIHATIYLDDAWAVGSLRRDIAEEPNRIYMTGVAPDGQRLRNAVYPGLNQGPAAPYPMNDDSSFGVGTTNADTDTGDGITVMVQRLRVVKYLDREDTPGGYDGNTERAIKALQDEAGLAETGVMNVATWNALFDLTATGYSLRDARIEPMAQRTFVRKWRLTASGALASRNPDYNANVQPVDLNVDAGSGFTHDQLREWARAELTAGDNWVGTITLNTGAVVAGEHAPGTPIDTFDVFPARSLRPGMNVWAPQFMGGTLFHVASAAVAEDGTVALAVDTRARDTMKVWQIIERNRESRYHPARAWIDQHRSSTMTKDGMGEWDAAGGVIEAVACEGKKWTVFPVPAGQEGTIRSIRIRTEQPAEFALAVFGRKVTPAWLAARVAAPLTVAGGKKWESEKVRNRLDDRFLLYAAGTSEEPCGYSPGKKHHKSKEAEEPNPEYAPDADENDTGTDDERVVTVTTTESWGRLTGKHEDDAGVSYHTFADPVLYVAVWVDRDTVVQGGRIMWNQLEAGS